MAVGPGAGKFLANVHVKGFSPTDTLPRLMNKHLTLKAREKEIIAAMKRAANPMKEAMGKLAPVRTGALSRSYASRKLQKAPRGTIGIRVGAVSGQGVFKGESYAKAGWRDHFAELGTINHGAHPHVQPAIRQKLGVYRQKLGAEMAGILKKLRTL